MKAWMKVGVLGLMALGTWGNVFLSANEKPHVLFIMSDDHAAHAIGAYGGRFAKLDPTPNLDRLAREGMRMNDVFCTNSICTPSRATILTGQYSHRNGVKTLHGSLQKHEQSLFVEAKKAGYETAIFGKWHLKEEPNTDTYSVFPGQGHYFNPTFRDSRVRQPGSQGDKLPWPENERRLKSYASLHSSDAVLRMTEEWLKGYEKRGKTKPMFLCVQFKAPHDDFENAERYDFLYEEVKIPEPESLRKRELHGPLAEGKPRMAYGTSVGKRNTRRNMGMHMHVDESLSEEEYLSTSYQRYLKKYLRCVKGVDDAVGGVLKKLEEMGILDDTLIVYTSDQGFMLGEHDYIDKRWMYEESLRMPFLVRYPKWIEAGRVSDVLLNNADFAPMLIEAMGGEVPAEMQGKSFLAELKGEELEWKRDYSYYRYWMHMAHHDNPAHLGIRGRRYKLMYFYGKPLDAKGAKKEETKPYWECYDLEKDPHEMRNVYDHPEYQEVVEKMRGELKKVCAEVGDVFPG